MTLRDDAERSRTVVPLVAWPVWAGIAVLLAAAPKSTGQDISGPASIERVTPHVLTTDVTRLAQRAPVRVWHEGMPVRIIEDLREGGEGSGGEGGTTGGGQPGGPTGATVHERRAPGVSAAETRAMPPVKEWKPGEPVRVMEDLRESGGGVQATAAPILGVHFDGIPATGTLPPDTVGDVGPNHYVQMVNTAFAIYDKAGNLLAGPVAINSLWSSFGGPCETQNNGDPIVRYDQLADRWLMSQFALPSGNYRQCFAVSRGPDPVSSGWFLYDFPIVDRATGKPVFPDYPKIGVWPDGYYMGTQRSFPNGGLDVWAFERQQMLNGAPAAAIQFAVSAPSLFLMPADLDGPPPSAGTPAFFVRQVDGERFGGADRLEVFAFTAKWSAPATSTFTLTATLPTAPFDSVLCSATLLGACVPQPGTSSKLETLTVWPMWRAQYRNFGTHESLVTNHTVDADGRDHAGIRWYELRRPPAGAWSIFQQGTHSPDSEHRWMGSLAMDSRGQLALGYSVSSATVSPGIRTATRLTSDPPGTLGPETVLINGAGSQTHSSSRWGNYSSMDLDPVDDCTFWYTTEYYDATSAAGWKTRVSSFRLPSCGSPEERYQYAAKAVCGIQKEPEDMRLARGLYATTVNIHNPQDRDVAFKKKLALTYPPAEQRPGKVIPIGEDRLRADEALKVDCLDIRRRLFPQGFPTPYIEGFVVIESNASLDVTGVYTTASLDVNGRVTDHSSIDVERVPERRLGGTKTGGECADLVVRDIGKPSVSCSGGVGTCVTKVEVTIANQGTAPAGPFKVRVVLDPAASVVVEQPVSAGMAAGASQVIPVVTPQGGNCFDPNCTICVTVDVADEVRECDEGNNKLCETTNG